MSKPTLTEDQEYCRLMLSEWAGGDHHLPDVHVFGTGVCINTRKGLSTYDFDRLTSLVLLAHRDSVRIVIASSGPRMVKVIAHRRKPMAPGQRMWEGHPTLDDLITRINNLKP